MVVKYMRIKRIAALISATILIVSALSACSVSGGVELETEFKTEEATGKQSATAETSVTEGKKFVVSTSDGSPLNLRKGAGIEFDIITTIEDGHTVMIFEQQGSWAKVNYGNYTGWVNMDYLKEETNTSTKTETTTSSSSSSPSSSSTSSTALSSPEKEKTTKSGYKYSYAGFNPQTITVNEDKWNLTLLNRYYCLPEGYVPKLAEAVRGSGVYLDYRVAPYYQKMYDAAKADGITLSPNSGYRSYQTQKTNFENRINSYISSGYDKVTATQNASRIILLPGTSEHNAGLAMDIGWVTQDFEKSSAFAWLCEHAQDYGFILRYPKSEAKQAITKIVYEPWHWRYVGVEAAKAMKASGQVLEEYLGKA